MLVESHGDQRLNEREFLDKTIRINVPQVWHNETSCVFFRALSIPFILIPSGFANELNNLFYQECKVTPYSRNFRDPPIAVT